MSESKFKQLQQNACSKTPEEILEELKEKEPDKICPTCIPNPSYIEPDWTQSEEPYLNEKQCEYQVKMMINFDADIYYDNTQRLLASSAVPEGSEKKRFVKLTDSPYPMKTLLKSYIRPAVRKMLRFYNKLETDEIVCASPPRSAGETCKGIFGLDYEEYVISEDQLTDTTVFFSCRNR